MSMSDPIADMLTRVRNGLQAGKQTVDVPRSNLKVAICRVLTEQGYLGGFEETETPAPGIIRIQLRYLTNRKPVLQGIKRISKPSLRVYLRHDEVKPVRCYAKRGNTNSEFQSKLDDRRAITCHV